MNDWGDHMIMPPLSPDVSYAALIDELRSPQGWAYASLASAADGDPGRFHALFGRDSLIFSLQLLQVRPEIATATLRALASLQGKQFDEEIDEEPGKIVHEYRPVAPKNLLEAGWPTRDDGIRYYGTADATSWFLVLLAAASDVNLTHELRGAWTAAGNWLIGALERGGGLIRSGPRVGSGGLSQHGWRDTLDPSKSGGGGILRPDGTPPQAPLADADSQAVAVAALRALASLDVDRKSLWQGLESTLRARISASFLPDIIAIEGTGAAVEGAGSWLGWLLWAGALDEEGARMAGERLVQPDILTARGIRTLSSSHPLYDSSAYHRGAVWPFDNWICWGGLRAAGFSQEATQVRSGVLSALRELGRPYELYSVDEAGAPSTNSHSNWTQAWTVGAAIALQQAWDGRLWV